MLKIFANSDIGKVRSSNQDCYDYNCFGVGCAWALVCDGMGGTNFGGVASSVAREIIKEEFNENFCEVYEKISSVDIKSVMTNALMRANTEIFNKSKEENFSNMGTTVVAVAIFGNALHVAHVGDSRAYVVSKDSLKQITNDHSVVQEMVKSGKITLEQAKASSQKNIITRAIGIESVVNIDYEQLILKKDEGVLLCTDGLTNYIDGEDLHSYFLRYDGQDFVTSLVDAANFMGGKDNITALFISRSL